MELAGIHPEVLLDVDLPDAVERRSSIGSVAQVAADIDALCEQLERRVADLAAMVRDGNAGDGAPGAAARDAMAAAGRLSGVATVLTAVAHTRMDATRAAIDDALRDSGAWAQRHAGLSGAETATARRVSRCLARYPQVAEAFLTGTVRGYHLAAIDSITPARFRGTHLEAAIEFIASIQNELLEAATLCETEASFRKFCAAVRARLDQDGPPPSSPEHSELSLHQHANGRWSLHGDLTADDGALWATFLDEEMRRLHDAAKAAGGTTHDDDTHDDSTRRDDSEATAPDGHATGAVALPLAVTVRRAQAAAELLRRGAATTRPGRIGLYVHLDLGDLVARGGFVPDAPVHTEAGYDLSDDTLWGLLANADVTPIINLDGSPLSYGRTRRLAPDILRRVLAHRDRTCCFPGCDSPAVWLNQHHLDDWAHGGTTDPANLRGTCRFHHHLHHDHGWALHPPDPDAPAAPGTYRVERPGGTPFDATPRWRSHPRRRHDPYRSLTLARLAKLQT